MPAVNPTRLRFQIDELMHYFASPPEFHRRLCDLFSLYANRSLRYGDSTEIKPLIPIYNLPAPVIRQLQIDLELRVSADPQSALLLADELWNDNHYEIKQTALNILGTVSVDSPDPIIDRLKTWLSPDLDAILIKYLFTMGTKKVQVNYPKIWEQFINSYLEKNNPEDQSIGLRGLSEGLKNDNFLNLPAIFRLISPIIHRPDRKLLHDLEELIKILTKKSTIETAHFLKQALSLSSSPETRRLVKQCLVFFPERSSQELKNLLDEITPV